MNRTLFFLFGLADERTLLVWWVGRDFLGPALKGIIGWVGVILLIGSRGLPGLGGYKGLMGFAGLRGLVNPVTEGTLGWETSPCIGLPN